MEIAERRAAITGIGQSDVGRRLERDPLELSLDACLAAIGDAGLERSQIDGLSTYPGGLMQGAPGFMIPAFSAAMPARLSPKNP